MTDCNATLRLVNDDGYICIVTCEMDRESRDLGGTHYAEGTGFHLEWNDSVWGAKPHVPPIVVPDEMVKAGVQTFANWTQEREDIVRRILVAALAVMKEKNDD